MFAKWIAALAMVVTTVLLPSSARAEWHEGNSPNFVVYADQSARDVQEFTEQLELYRSAMLKMLNVPDYELGPSNRVSIYVVGSISDVRKLYGDRRSAVAGFYQSRAGASLAVIPRVKMSNVGEPDFSQTVLLHEYAHHFMFINFPGSFPLWFTEGFAEFFGSARFEKGKTVKLGYPAFHRTLDLAYAKDVPIDLLLDTEAYSKKTSNLYDSFYARSWGLYHYLTYGEDRQGQFGSYLSAFGANPDGLAAAESAFGDLEKLDKDIDRYLRSPRLGYTEYDAKDLNPLPAKVRKMTEGEGAIMPLKVQSKRGVTEEQAKELVVEVRSVAERFPNDPFVLASLAEAEVDAGNNDAAIAAADRALAIDPSQMDALIQKGYALARIAEDEDTAEAWHNVRAQFVSANRVDPNNPIALRYFYESFVKAGEEVPEPAIRGLKMALELAPFAYEIRQMVAVQQLKDGDRKAAIATLQPFAFVPHNTKVADHYRSIINRLKAGEDVEITPYEPEEEDEEGGEDDGEDS
ncbi:MAG: DUF1570 domain-containing protein [Blastomonas sp.]